MLFWSKTTHELVSTAGNLDYRFFFLFLLFLSSPSYVRSLEDDVYVRAMAPIFCFFLVCTTELTAVGVGVSGWLGRRGFRGRRRAGGGLSWVRSGLLLVGNSWAVRSLFAMSWLLFGGGG